MQTGKNKFKRINGENLKIAIVLPYFNEKLGLELLKNAKKELIKNDVQEKNIAIVRVAGALEIPFACKKIIKNGAKFKFKIKPDAIIALGVVIRGETSHFELVTNTAYQGLMKVQLDTGVPISFGILACENIEQAKKRVSKGQEAAQAALLQTTRRIAFLIHQHSSSHDI